MDSLVLLHIVITRFQNFWPEEAITCFCQYLAIACRPAVYYLALDRLCMMRLRFDYRVGGGATHNL